MLTSRKEDALREAMATIVPSGDAELDVFAANAGDPEAAHAAVAATIERFGRLDLLVNNAATNPYMGPMIDIDLPRLDKTYDVNLRGAFVWTQEAWRQWFEAHGGNVINISSIGGHVDRDVDRPLQRDQGRADPPHQVAGPRPRADRAGERHLSRSGEDRHGPRAVGRERGRHGRR